MSATAEALRATLAELAAARYSLTMLKAAKQRAEDAFNLEHVELLTAIAQTAEKAATAEANTRTLVLAMYDVTGEKKPVEGASVVIRTTYSYDADEALRWAETALPTAITRKLDTKAIDKIASTGTLPFAMKIETPAVQIGSDLSSYLTEGSNV